MVAPPIPIRAYLVPDEPLTAPNGFATVEETIRTSLPYTFSLGDGFTATLLVPTGLAVFWRDADPSDVVSSSDLQDTSADGLNELRYHKLLSLLTLPEAASLPRIIDGLSDDILVDVARILELGSDLARPEIVAVLQGMIRQRDPLADLSVGAARLVVRDGSTTVGILPLVMRERRFVPDGAGLIGGVQIELAILSWDIRAGNLRGAGTFGSRIAVAWRVAENAVEQYSTPPINPYLIPRLPEAYRTLSLVFTEVPIQELALFERRDQFARVVS